MRILPGLVLAHLSFAIPLVAQEHPDSCPAPCASRPDPDGATTQRPGSEGILRRPARLHVEEVPLRRALGLLHRAADVPLLFSPSLLPASSVTCRCAAESVRGALERILKGTGLRFEEYGRQVIVLPAAVKRHASVVGGVEEHAPGAPAAPDPSREARQPSTPAAPRVGGVTGRVTDGRTGEPLASIQIHVASLDAGVLSRQDGRFELQELPPGRHAVVAERIGYRTVRKDVEVRPGEVVVLDLALLEEPLYLDEIIVTGTPGGSQRRAIGNAVGSVSASELTGSSRIGSMQDLLTGQTPGLDFLRNSGNVGTGSQLRIRGVSSFELNQQPLIYVDGVRVNNSGTAGPFLGGGSGPREGQVSVLDDFSPDEIETIEIIKGPAAATLYGTEASAGVVQIITKRGEPGAPRFHASVSRGANYMPDPSGKLGTQWGLTSDGRLIEGFGGYANIYDYEKHVRGRELFQYGRTRSYSLDVRGGAESVHYFLSSAWQDEGGVVDYNWNERLNLRANVSILFGDALTLDVSTGFLSGMTSFAQQLTEPGGIWEVMHWAQPELKDTDRRGFLRYTPEELATVEATRAYQRFTASAILTHRAGNWWSQRLVVGLDRSHDENQVLVPRHPRGTASAFGGLGLGDVSLERPTTREWTLDYSASAEFGRNDGFGFTTSLGAQYYSTELNEIDGHGSVLASPSLRSIAGATRVSIGQHFVQNKSLGIYAQQELDWQDRIFLTGAVRGDDNSAFGSRFDAAIYPKISGTWVISEEAFWSVPYLSSLRLRSALGQAGRQPDTFDAVTLHEPVMGRGGEPAMVPASLGNPDVGPEVGTELEIGFDYGLLEDRISGEFTYFHQWTTEALADLPLVPSLGFSGTEALNLGQLNNWGWEATLEARLVNRSSWALDLGLAADHADNTIVDLGGRLPTQGLREGVPYPVETSAIIVSAEFDEFGNPTNVMCDAGTGPLGLDPGGTVIPCGDAPGHELILGTAYPQYHGAVDLTIYVLGRDLQLFALAEGEHGAWRASTSNWCRFAGCFTNTRVSLTRDDPIYVEGQVFQQRHPRDDTLVREYDASFWKLRRIGVRFQLPERWTGGLGAERASISVSGSDLWTIWRRTEELSGAPIPDPEFTGQFGGTDSDLGMMPPLSSFSARLDLTF